MNQDDIIKQLAETEFNSALLRERVTVKRFTQEFPMFNLLDQKENFETDMFAIGGIAVGDFGVCEHSLEKFGKIFYEICRL